MALPQVQCAMALTTDPSATPSWTDVTSYLEGFSLKRGRQYELGAVQAGTLTLRLDNRDRRFDPTYTGGPYGSNVKLRRRVRVQAVWDSVTYDLMHGYVTRYLPAIAPSNGDAVMTVQATDGFRTLAKMNLNTSFAAQRSDVRLGAALDAVGWLAADRDLGQGLQNTQAVTLAGVKALTHLQRVVDDEAGFLWINRAGQVAFRNRYQRLRPDVTTHVTLGDGGGSEQLYQDVAFSFDDELVVNDVRVTRQGGVEQVASDATSQAEYLTSTLPISGLQAEDGDALSLALYTVATRKQPRLRAGAVVLTAHNDPTVLWPHILGRELGDRIGLKRRPPGGGTMDQPSHIEGVAIDWTARGGRWGVKWDVSPADVTQYWLLGDATYGVLGSTTRLAP